MLQLLRILRASSLALIWLAFGVAGLGAQTDGESEVVVGEIKGIINPVMAGYVDRVIGDAERSNANAVVFYLDTPGGLADAMRDIDLRILASRVPVVVYIAPDGARAGSAGVYITYAAHVSAMAPATNIGSATPVAMGENGAEAQLSEEMRNKITNDAVAGIRALAEQRRRDAEFAEKAVREGANLHASEALKAGVVDYIATDLNDLLRQIDGKQVHLANGTDVTLSTADATIREADPSAIESFMHTITNPTIAYILLSMGSLGLLLELYNPGSIFPGVIGGICLLLAFYALGTLPLNFAGLALIAFALLLFALEPFVTSHGVLAVGGVIAFVIGSLLLINAPESPYLQISPVAIVAMTVLFLVFFLVLVVAVLRLRSQRVKTGREGLVGASGVVRSAVQPNKEGFVFVQGELWKAISTSDHIGVDERVVVESMDGLQLKVRRASDVIPAPPRPPSPVAAKAGLLSRLW
jgi:membrane-bound serine protease (ClpP class)